jgi:hypothetical protein
MAKGRVRSTAEERESVRYRKNVRGLSEEREVQQMSERARDTEKK